MHFALICPPFKSHLAVFQAIGAELRHRGHRVSFVLNDGAGHYVASGFDVYPVAGTDRAYIEAVVARAAKPNGPFGILRTVRDSAFLSDHLCAGAPAVLRSLGVDAVLADQMEPAAGLVARHASLPYLSIACALPIERDDAIPLPFLPWPYDGSERGLKRNRGGEKVARVLLTAQRRTIARWSERFALKDSCHDLQSCLSPLGTIAQTTVEFDFARQPTQRPLHAVGPIRVGNDSEEIDFTVDPRKPFVFMSLGTLQGHRYRLFHAAAAACRRLGAQLLVAHCGGLDDRQAHLLGATWVTDFAPQRAILRKADLCITHAGHNTVMDALAFGKPVLAIPIAFDQPGIAARIAHHGIGVRLSRHFVTASRMEAAIRSLLREDSYRLRAADLGRSVSAAGGLNRAVDIIEATFMQKAA